MVFDVGHLKLEGDGPVAYYYDGSYPPPEGQVDPAAITPTATAGVTTDVHRLWPWFLALSLLLLPVDALLRRTARVV